MNRDFSTGMLVTAQIRSNYYVKLRVKRRRLRVKGDYAAR